MNDVTDVTFGFRISKKMKMRWKVAAALLGQSMAKFIIGQVDPYSEMIIESISIRGKESKETKA